MSLRQPSLPASYIPRLRPGLLSLRSVLSFRQILLCSCFVVLLFSCLVVCIAYTFNKTTKQQNNKTTKQPDNKTTRQH